MISLKQKQWIDRSLGKLLCYILAPIVRLTGLILRLDHTLDQCKVHTIVIAKYYGMGSIIHATGLLRELKKCYPAARIIFLTRKANGALMKHVRFVDEVMTIDDGSIGKLMQSVLKIIGVLWKCRVDLFFDLEVYSCFSALMSLFALARNRIGFFAGRPSDYKSFLYNHLVYMNANMPVRTCYMLLGKVAGIPLDASSDLDELNLAAPGITARMKDLLQKIAPVHEGKTKIAVNVNASELSFARRWDKENFAEVCRNYAEKGCHIYLVGSPGERSYVQEVRDLIPPELPVFNVAGSFPFSEFLVFLKSCDLLLTNDAGLMNVGFILKMKVLSLWGPGLPSQYHVDSNWTKYLKADVYCSPCLYITEMSPCKYHDKPICMTKIKPDEVMQAMEQLLAVTEPYRSENNPYDTASGQDKMALGVMYDAGLDERQKSTKEQPGNPHRGSRLVRQLWDCCNWKTASLTLFFTITLSLFLLDFLLKKNWISSTPVQMLSCYAYVWEPLNIANRLFAVGCTAIAALLIGLGILCGISFMAQQERENLFRFGVLSALPALYPLILGQFNVKTPVDTSWVAVSVLLFFAVFWLQLWRKKSVTGLDFALLFESFFLPFGFCTLARCIAFSVFPENYQIFYNWTCQHSANLPYYSFGIVLVLLSFPKNASERYRRILGTVLQLLMLALFMRLLPEVYLKQGQLFTLHPYGKTFRYVIFPLLSLGSIDVLLRAWNPDFLKRNFSPFPLLAILAFWHFNHFSVMGLSNFYEFGDRISTYSAIRSGAMTFFKDATLCYGGWDYLSLRLTEFFSGTLTMADTCGESLMVLGVLTASFYVFFHLFPVWVAFLLAFFIGGWVPALLAALIALWIQPELLKRRALWCVFWSVTAAGMFFFRIPQGAMLGAAFLPLFLYQFFHCFKEDKIIGKRLLIFELLWALLFFVWPFSPCFYGMLRIITETGSINSAWAASAWECGSGNLLAFLAANAVLFLPIVAAIVAGIFRFAETPLESKEGKTFAWGIFSATLCYVFCALSYSFSRIDDLFSRQYQTLVTLMPLLLVPAFQLPEKYRKLRNLLLVLTFAPLLAVPVVRELKTPESPVQAMRKTLPVMDENAMVDGKSFGLPKAGYGYAPAGCREELQAERELKTVLDQVLKPDETFLNLSLYGGLYFLFDRQQPAQHTNYYTVTGDLTQFRMLAQLRQKNVEVTVFGRDLYDFSYPMLRTHYLFRYAVQNARPLKVNDKYFVMMPERSFRKLQQPVPSLAESLKIWEDFYNSGSTIFQFNNLVYTAAVWGRNAEKLLKSATEAKLELPLPQGDAHNQKICFAGPLAGVQWGILEINSTSECWAGVSWSNEFGTPCKVCFKLMPGKNLVPLDAYPNWLWAKTNRDLTIFSQDNELKINAVTIYQRRLPAEMKKKKSIK